MNHAPRPIVTTDVENEGLTALPIAFDTSLLIPETIKKNSRKRITQAMPPAPVPLPPVKSRYTSNPIATVTQIMAIVTRAEILFKVDTALEETPVYDARSPSVPAIFEKPVIMSRSDTEAPRMFTVAQGMRNNGARSKMSVAIRVLLSL